jgi:hypothetical protein
MEEVNCIQEQEEMPISETSRKPSGRWDIKSMWYRLFSNHLISISNRFDGFLLSKRQTNNSHYYCQPTILKTLKMRCTIIVSMIAALGFGYFYILLIILLSGY